MLVARIVKLVEVTFTCQGFAIGAFECIMLAIQINITTFEIRRRLHTSSKVIDVKAVAFSFRRSFAITCDPARREHVPSLLPWRCERYWLDPITTSQHSVLVPVNQSLPEHTGKSACTMRNTHARRCDLRSDRRTSFPTESTMRAYTRGNKRFSGQ
jgi:hypothetical protein